MLPLLTFDFPDFQICLAEQLTLSNCENEGVLALSNFESEIIRVFNQFIFFADVNVDSDNFAEIEFDPEQGSLLCSKGIDPLGNRVLPN